MALLEHAASEQIISAWIWCLPSAGRMEEWKAGRLAGAGAGRPFAPLLLLPENAASESWCVAVAGTLLPCHSALLMLRGPTDALK